MAGTGAAGSWTGSIVDVCGYAGSLELELTVQGSQVSGHFRIAIADGGEPFVCEGELSGTDGADLALQFAFGPAEAEVHVAFRGKAFGLAGGGAGMSGTYDVTAQTFSPFRAGVVALYRHVSAPTAELPVPISGSGVGSG